MSSNLPNFIKGNRHSTDSQSKPSIIVEGFGIYPTVNHILEGYAPSMQDRIAMNQENVSTVDRVRAVMSREAALSRLFNILAGLLIADVLIIIMAGFHFFGFSLDKTTLHLIVGSIIPELAGLLAIVLRGVARRQ